MAYDPIYFENAGTVIGQANTVAAPGGNGTWTIVGETAFLFLPDSTNIEIEENGTLVGSFQTLNIEGASVSLSGVTATVDVPSQDTFSSGSGITLSGTAPDFTIGNTGVLDLVQGSVSASGVITVGSNLTLSGQTLSGSAGGGGGITEFVQGSLTATGAATLGSGLSLSGTLNPTITGTGELLAQVGTTTEIVGTIASGAGFSFSGTSPDLTLNNSGVIEFVDGSLSASGAITLGTGLSLSGNTINAGSASAGITEFVQGTLTATGAATLGSGLTLSGTLNPTLSSSGGGGIVAEVGTVSSTFSTLDAGANITFSGTSPNLTISASSTASSNLTFENGGTSVGTAGTLNAGSGTTLAVSGGVATISAGGGGGARGLFTLPAMPALSGFTQQNISGTGSVVEVPGIGFTVSDSAPTASTTTNRGLSIAVPSVTPYRVAIFCLFNGVNFAFNGFGFGWTNGSGDFDTLAYSGSQSFDHENLSPLSTRVTNTDSAAPSLIGASSGVWLGLRDDGAGNVFWEISADGANYTTLLMLAKTGGFLGASGYTDIYFGLRAYAFTEAGVDFPLSVTFLAYDPNGLTRTIG